MTQIAVIGAGVTGLTTAYELLDRGFDVTVFDRHRYAAMETSFANGGQLSASNAEVWTQWGTVLKGLKWMLSADAPLLVNPAPTLHKMRWMAEFLSNIPNYRRNTVETVRLAIAARAVLFEMAAREGIDFDLEQRGILHFYDRQKDMAHARMVNGLLADGGLVRRELSPAEIREVEPALAGDFVGGFLTESDSSGDIHKFTIGLARACARRGADLRFGTEIDGVEAFEGAVRVVSGGREEAFDGVVVSAGIRSRDLAQQLGDRVNVYPVKGYSITVALNDAGSQAAAPWVSLLDDRAKIVASRFG
ncbi:MAG TPA: FAD-dependent oxidoreductase, partial [Reyranella sp.]|nr:FAD-dependent oxidoreductase [Reyranella sp.]